ncbi:MAG: transporter [Sulfuritalea sp.]|jgi:hypothetical protein|nr:transporter [Sulfuritalea sp.]
MKRHPSISIAGGLLLAAAAPAVFAFQPLITDDTGTQGKGGNQLEFSVNEDRASLAGDTTKTRTLQAAYTRGVSETLDVYFAAGLASIRSTVSGADADGGGNPALGAKWRFFENEASKTSFGLKPEIRLPISADKETAGLGTGRTSYGLTLIMTQEVPFGAVHANLAAGRNRFSDKVSNPDDATTTRASIAPVWDVSEEWKLALDVGSETEAAGGNRTRSNFAEIGAIYSPNKDIDFALGFVRRNDNANPRTTTNSATAGVTWRFK